MAHMVTIQGTWSRTNTSIGEVNLYRNALRRRIRRLGGTFDARLPNGQRTSRDKSGTFTATLPIRNFYGNRARRTRVVKLLLESIMAQEFCRSPRLKVDAAKTRYRESFDKAAII